MSDFDLADYLQNKSNAKIEKDVVASPKTSKTPRKSNKLETKFNELNEKFHELQEKMELYLEKPKYESELLAECALRFRDLLSWKRFSEDTPYGKKLLDLLNRIENRN
jgi:hypothetical protein